MFGAALIAFSFIAALRALAGLAALGAKRRAQIPIQHAFGLRQNGQLGARHIASGGQAAQIFKLPHALKRPDIFGRAHMAYIGGK